MKCPNFEKCGAELTEMPTGCKRCLVCNPMTKYVPPASKESKYVDVPWTDERVIEVIDKVVPDMIREVLENWHIQRPPVTKIEIEEDLIQHDHDGNVSSSIVTLNPENWRQQAKRLGIEVYDKTNKKPRLKIEVLRDIQEKTNVQEELQAQE